MKQIDLEKSIGDAIVEEAWAIEGLPAKALISGVRLLGRAAITAYLSQQRMTPDPAEGETMSKWRHDLKGCPFCGTDDVGFCPALCDIGATVICRNLECKAEQNGDTDQEAIERWNKRPIAAPNEGDALSVLKQRLSDHDKWAKKNDPKGRYDDYPISLTSGELRAALKRPYTAPAEADVSEDERAMRALIRLKATAIRHNPEAKKYIDLDVSDVKSALTRAKSDERVVVCKGCDKPQSDVQVIVHIRNGVYICGDCVELCNHIIATEPAALADEARTGEVE